MCFSRSYVFIPQHYSGLLAPCCNLTNHLKQIPHRNECNLKYSNPPGCQLHLWWRCSDPQNSNETGQTYELMCGKYTEYVKEKYEQPKFCLKATKVVLLQKTILIWDGRNHLVVTLLIRKRQHRYTAWKGFPLHQSEPMEVHFCWMIEWRHVLGLIRCLLKSI